jgi:hypothetical protein
MRRVDHLRVRGSPVSSKLQEQVFPDATPCPAHEAVIDRCRRTISFRAIAPAAAALEHVYDPADHAPVVCSLDAAHIRRQMRFNPCPLLVVQPEQISAHQFFPNTNQYRIVQTEKLMSSDPNRIREQGNQGRLWAWGRFPPGRRQNGPGEGAEEPTKANTRALAVQLLGRQAWQDRRCCLKSNRQTTPQVRRKALRSQVGEPFTVQKDDLALVTIQKFQNS